MVQKDGTPQQSQHMSQTQPNQLSRQMLAFTSAVMARLLVTLMTLFLFTLMTSSVEAQRQAACSTRGCACNPNEVWCTGVHTLSAVPVKIPQNTTRLAFIDTNISRIEQNDFAGLENLQTLFLQGNRISFIHKFAFRNLYRLETLNLERNKLTNLDMGSLMFQHLSSIKNLVLQQNEITRVNRYSFLTAVANKQQLEIRMHGNQIQCDCNVLAMRNWIDDVVPSNRIAVKDLKCSNDPMGRTFDRVPLSSNLFSGCGGTGNSDNDESVEDLFLSGNPFAHEETLLTSELSKNQTTLTQNSTTKNSRRKCINVPANIDTGGGNKKNKNKNDDGDDSDENMTTGNGYQKCGDLSNIFDVLSTCADCEKERTNYACNLRPRKTCVGLQEVCVSTVSWKEDNLSMLISSRCEIYTSCLDREAENAERCGVGYQSNGNVHCEFCCFGPTCVRNTIGGRTYDMTFRLSYVNKNGPYQSYMGDPSSSQFKVYKERVASGVRSDIRTVRGGVDVYLYSLGAENQSAHRVNLRIEVTAMTYVPESDILLALQRDMGISVGLPTGFLFKENVVQDSVELRETYSGISYCPNETTTSSKGTITWDMELAGIVQIVPCPYDDVNVKPLRFANRSCVLSGTAATWDSVNDEDCPVENYIDDIFNTKVTPDNVFDVASRLIEMTDSSSEKELTADQLDEVVTVLEECVKPENIKEAGVADIIVQSLSNLMDIDLDVMRSGEIGDETSSRIMNLLNDVAEKAPLTDGKLKIVAPNFAIAAQAIDEGETREVTLVTNKETGTEKGFNSNQINVDFTEKSKQPSMDKTNLVVPISAIVKTLSRAEKRQLERVSFIVHRSDKLFSQRNTTVLQSMQDPREERVKSRTVSDGGEAGANADTSSNMKEPTQTRHFVTEVNSMVLAASVPGITVRDLSENVTMTFEHKAENATNPRCVFWDEVTNSWSSDGCGVVTSTTGITQCGCNHLTNFALLMDVYQEGTGLSSLDREILSFISYVGCGVSLAALVLTIVTYTLFRKLRRDNPSKILINLCLALLLSNLVYLVGMHDYSFDNSTACKIVAVLLHYSLLASLTWMAVEAFYMYLALILVFKTYFTNFILKCALVGWGVPLLIVIVTLAVDATDNYGFINSGMCWLRNPAFYAAFVGPVCLILLVNCLAFALVIKQLSNMASSKLTKTDRNNTVQRLRGAIGIVILLGLTWIFAVFAIGEASVVFYYLFAIFNSLQGLFIFIFYCVMKKDAMSSWKRLLPCFEEYGDSTKTSSNSKDFGGVSQTATNINAVNVKYKAASSTHGISSTTATSVASDSRKGSVAPILEEGDISHSIDDADIYINLENHNKSPSYTDTANDSSSGGTDNPAMQRYPYSDQQPTAYIYRNGNPSSPKDRFSPEGQVHCMQPFGPAFSFSGISYEQQIPRPHLQGEVDTSNMAKVRELRLKYERTTSQTSNNSKTNI